MKYKINTMETRSRPLRILFLIVYAFIFVLVGVGLTVLTLQWLNPSGNSCDFSSKELVNIVNLETNNKLKDDNNSQTVEFTGKYKMTKSENFGNFLEELGVGFVLRAIASRAHPDYHITQNDDDSYTLKTVSEFKTSEITFKFGEPFEESRMDGATVNSTITRNGNKWIQKQVGDSNTVTIVRDFRPDGTIRVTGVVNEVGFERIYEKTDKLSSDEEESED
ncbi:fatty acid-binding protein-like [Oppia nitens]|uniref:fatty acid-binding protein-like n=1 Tax=Oppia nitens TaxID=1686743 RepID=UPI0023DC9D67|nr:fatty acid-binding protein-like [Oppia nitens]